MIERLEIDSLSIGLIDLQTLIAAHTLEQWLPRADDAPSCHLYVEIIQTYIMHFLDMWGDKDESVRFEALYESFKHYEIRPPDKTGFVMHCIAKARFKKWTSMFDFIYKPGTKQAGWGERIEANL